MKQIISIFLMVIVFALFMPVMPATAAVVPSFENYTLDFSDYKPCPGGTHRVRRNTKTGKKLLNAAIAGGIGAAIGGGIGGKRGALIGVGSGAGGYLVYRYVKDKHGRCVQRVVRG